jgi:subtilisin family serine protease
MKRIAVVGVALLLIAATCAPASPNEYNVKVSCKVAEGIGLEVVRDLSEIGWCTVRGKLPFAVTALPGTEVNGTWGLPASPEKQAEIALGDPLYPQQWGLRAIHAPEAWQIEQGDAGTIVALLDTGIDRNHADLPPPVKCLSTIGSSCQDDHGHGTHVAGIVAMQTNDVGGVGVAPHVSIAAIKVLDADGNGSFSGIAAGILGATQAGADVISMSFGGQRDSNLVSDAIDYAFEHGVLLVAACGNSGQTHLGDICLSPARRPNVLSVGAVDNRSKPVSWSNRRPDVLAPGVDIVSTIPDNRYATWSGTSMAAPHVAGAIALYISAVGSIQPQALMDRIRGTTTEIEGCNVILCGSGLVNAHALLVDTPRPTPTAPVPTAYPPPEVTATPTKFFRTPTPADTATIPPLPTLTPTPTSERCTITVNRVARSDSANRWWVYVGASFLNFLGRDGELLESYVVNLPQGWWSLVLSAPSTERCGLWRSTFEDLGYAVGCAGACP